MAASYFFYDLETSGISARTSRIMQFAGQRTDMDFQPIGDPVNVLVKLSPDTLPDPDAVLITGITPQQTITDGLTEAEFLKYFYDEIWQPDTIFLGYNTVRFDDEFMRYLHWRNFYDPYEWQWKNGCSRWDLLDVARMTRALRPDGIEWPFTPEGKCTNRLELITKLNGLDHAKAHDALNDVYATIAVAKLLRDNQPGLYDYLLGVRKKNEAKAVIDSGKPFMYASGRYPGEFLNTTVSVLLGRHAKQDYALVYDLRQDPAPFLTMNVDELIEAWRFSRDPEHVKLPVKTLKYNRCPAVVPGVVKDEATLERLSLDRDTIARHLAILQAAAGSFVEKLFKAVDEMDDERSPKQLETEGPTAPVDERLYENFINKADAPTMRAVRAAKPDEFSGLAGSFKDERLEQLLPLYKARNYPRALSGDERQVWDQHCQEYLLGGGTTSRLAAYFKRLEELTAGDTPADKQYLLDELRLYGESIVPSDVV